MHVVLGFYQILLKLFVFLEFSKNRLVALNTRQVTHAFRTHFLGFAMNRLAIVCYPPNNANWIA